MRRAISGLIQGSLLLALAGCGNITLGGGTYANDPVPSGVIVAQGQFAGQNGRTVSGTVSIYKNNCGVSTCDYVVRLQNLSAPTDVTLLIVATINGAPATNTPTLRYPTGTQNYTFTAGSVSATWNQIALHPSGSVIGVNDYGLATLNPVASP